MADVRGSFRSFPAAQAYFAQKVNLPTQRWDDLLHGQHARAFVVAGVTRDALLTDLRTAVDAAISNGETLADFRARFRDIVQRQGWHGWTGEGTEAGFNWRTSVIYHTNLRTAYMAGRWETLKSFPYLRYQHNTTRNPREEHQAWDGKIIATGDPWWQTHYPPNGWGCRCSVTGVSEAGLRALGQTPDEPPGPGKGDPPPEWAYHVGEAHSGRAGDPPEASGRWEELTPGNWESAGRPATLPTRATEGEPLRGVQTQELLMAALTAKWGAPRKNFTLTGRNGERFDVTVDAERIARHLPADRAPFAGYIDDVLSDPDEIYLAFVRNPETRRVALRLRVVRAIDVEGRTMFAALDARQGRFEGWTIYRRRSPDARGLRRGKLVYARE